MEKDIQLKGFEFFKKEPEKRKVETSPKSKKDYEEITFKTFLGSSVLLILLLFGAMVHEVYHSNTAREKVFHAFASGNIEHDLNQLNTPIKMSKFKDKINYSFKVSIPRIYGLVSPGFQYYEIEKTKTSHTLIVKDQRVEGIDSKLSNFKELLQNVELAEIKTLPNIKTGGMDISFKVED